MRFFSYCFVFLLLIFVPIQYNQAQNTEPGYQVMMGLEFALRDGVHLNATVYRPYPFKDPLPVILTLTPYVGASSSNTPGEYFATHGYIFVNVQERGRGDSEGEFDPFIHDGQDGYDAVEWLAKQPWCNGKVAMFGGSYEGGDQWLVAMARPPHLVTISPTASARPGVDFPAPYRMMWGYGLTWLTLNSGRVLYRSLGDDTHLWDGTEKRLYLDKAAFKDLDAYLGTSSDLFQTWLRHPNKDEYWRARGGAAKQIAQIRIPILEITGANDYEEIGTLSYHADYSAGLEVRSENYLVIGPWDHSGTRSPKQVVAQEHFGVSSLVDLQDLQRQWFDYTMKNGLKPRFLQKPVMYYVAGQGAECWKSADSLDKATTEKYKFFLNASGGANSLYHSGVLQLSFIGSTGAEWVSDPNDLSAAGLVNVESESNAFSLAAEPQLHGNGLVFHSAPLPVDTELTGQIDLKLWLSIDTPDTDLRANLYLISPDGVSHPLSESMLRARYRNSEEHPEQIHEGQPELYRFNSGQWFAVRASKGSQIRLIVTSLNEPGYEKNWNSMKPVAEQTGRDSMIAHIRLLQTPEHSSTLTIPMSSADKSCAVPTEAAGFCCINSVRSLLQ